MKCTKCGHQEEPSESLEIDQHQSSDESTAVKDEVLAELIEVMNGSLGSKLKKPAATPEVSIEMISAKPKDDEEEDEEEA